MLSLNAREFNKIHFQGFVGADYHHMMYEFSSKKYSET